MKSALPGSLTAAFKSAISSASASASSLGGPKPKRAFGTLVDVTNTRASDRCEPLTAKAPSKSRGVLAEKTSSKSVRPAKSAKSARTVLSPKKASPIARREQASPSRRSGGCARARARARARASPSPRRSAIKPPAFRRIDPPSFDTAAIDSIDSLLAAASRPSKLKLFVDTPPPTHVVEPVPLIAHNIPDSWVFDIYEDTPEETLQNLMEHSTCTLDISDDSDDESVASELHEKGKENIAPARLAELLSVAPVERANVMRVDTAEKNIPQRRGARREALREMLKEELVLPEKKPIENKLPTLANDKFPVFTPPKKEKAFAQPQKLGDVTPKSPDSPGFVVWESDHEEESKEDDEADIAARVPLPDDEVDLELERELAEQEFDTWGNDAASLGGSSDVEN